jgi:glycosyltransferase involved in cell wall biosynthesis
METPSDTATNWSERIQELASTLRKSGIDTIESFAWRDLADPDAGGSEVHADHVMARWAAAGLTLRHRTSTDSSSETFQRHGYSVTRRGGRYSVFARVILRRLFTPARKNVAIVEIWNGVPWFSQLWRNPVRSVWLHHIHEDMWKESLPSVLAPIARWVEISFAPLFYQRTRIATLATTTRDELVTRGYNPHNVVVAEPGIDPRFVPNSARKSHTPTLVAVGRLAPVKRFPLLLQTFAQVIEHIPDAHLTIAGVGPDKELLEREIDRLGVQAHVTLAGRISDDELLSLYQSSWLLVSASHSEGWGMTITEAAASGTPCVVTDNHGHRAAAVHGRTGLIVSDDSVLASSIIDVLSNDTLRTDLQRGAREHAQKFQWDRTAALLLQTVVDSLPQ